MKKVELLPYCRVDGLWTFKDSEIGYLYTTLEKAGRLKSFFYDGTVLSKEGFIQRMKDEKLWVIAVENKIKGIVCLTDFRQATAQGHFAFFTTDKDTLEVARETGRQLIHMKDTNGNYVFSVLLGITPEKNQLAIKFTEAFGGKRLCNIPNYIFDETDQCFYDGVLFSITREE